jgi:hypothetical protein
MLLSSSRGLANVLGMGGAINKLFPVRLFFKF